MIRVGTSGFSYADWVGIFYPAGTGRHKMLSYYSKVFSLVEIDFTYYRMPSFRTIAAMEQQTPGNFVFCVKTFKDLTHRRDLPGAEMKGLAGQFMTALSPLRDAGKLGCVLAQFPWSFKASPENFEFIAELQSALTGADLVIEFRNLDWVKEETFSFLRDFGLSFCCVDEPGLLGLFPPLGLATSENLSYIRFHGRNSAKWWKHEEAWERYDYHYSQAELTEWLPKIKDLAGKTRDTYILMNNCHAGYAAQNAKLLMTLLVEAGIM